MKRHPFLFLFVFLFPVFSIAQKQRIDSLQTLLKTAKEDTAKIKNLNALSVLLFDDDAQNSLSLANKALALSQKLNYVNGIATSYFNLAQASKELGDYEKCLRNLKITMTLFNKIKNNPQLGNVLNELGTVYYHKSDYDSAKFYFEKSLEIKKTIGDKQGMASAFNNIAIIYRNKGDHEKALDYNFKALKLREEINDKKGIAGSYTNIGIIYDQQNNYAKAMEYDFKSLKIKEELGNKNGIAKSLDNIGVGYTRLKNYKKALEYNLRALKLREEINDKNGMAYSLTNLGAVYENLKYYDKFLECSIKSLSLREEMGDKYGIAMSAVNVGLAYSHKGKYAEGAKSMIKSLSIAKEIGAKELIRDCYKTLALLYEETKDYKTAYDYKSKYVVLKDSMLSEESSKQLNELETRYEKDKKEKQILILQKDKSIQDLELGKKQADLKKQRIFTFSAIIVLVLVLCLAFIALRAYRNKKKAHLIITKQKRIVEEQKFEVEKQKDIIEIQKHLVEEHQKDIIDSITYAKRIQQAILPPYAYIQQHLPESFILFKPKDIVAGDFYWMENKDDFIFIAAADCTGHGVPGAMVSVVCSNALNRTVNEFEIIETGKILDKTRELVLQTFAKSETDVKDGMDISLCSINIKTKKVCWSGANNPLWYFKNGEHAEITAHKQPIGKTDDPTNFPTHTIELNKGDELYLLTDGYADQFGGPKGKKFKYKQLLDILKDNMMRSPKDQKEVLQNEFEQWKGNLEQVDDVTIIGIRL